MNKLVIGNLAHRPLRSAISVLAIALEVVLILIIAGIMGGQLADTRTRTTGIGADMMVEPGTGSFMSGMSGAPLSVKVAPVLEKMPHVQVAAPVAIQLTTGSAFENIYGIDFASFNALRPFKFLSGGPFAGPYDVIVDDYFARSGKGHKVGEPLKILDRQFRISGIVEHGKGGRKFIPLATMGQLTGAEGKATLFYLKIDNEKNADLVKEEIKAQPGMSQYQVQTMDEWLSLVTQQNLPAVFTIGMHVVIGIAMIIGFIVIFQSMYTAVLERTREIGILKSLGASRGMIVGVVLRETSVLAIAGVVLGMVMAWAGKGVMKGLFPTLLVVLTGRWFAQAAVLALIGALVGAAYPAWKAARKDPIDALAYE
jgi:putative ABC transport system permease protein